MKVSIIGSNSFVAGAIGEYCNINKINVHAYGRSLPKKYYCSKFSKLDLLVDDIDLSDMIDSDLIIYAAGAGIQSNRKENFSEIFKLNVSSPINIFKSLDDADYKGSFVTFGSAFEVGVTTANHKMTEVDVLTSLADAPSDYVVTKRMLSRFISSANAGFNYYHFILPSVYGASELPHRIIRYTVDAIKNKEELHFTSGEQIRHYLHVSDIPGFIVEADRLAIESGVYNIPGTEALSVRQVVEKIHRYFETDVPENCFGAVTRADVSMKCLMLDGNKLFKALNIRPSIKLDSILYTY